MAWQSDGVTLSGPHAVLNLPRSLVYLPTCLPACAVQGTSAQNSTTSLKVYDQCGGSGGNCRNYTCANDVFPSARCPNNTACLRQNSFYWQCLPCARCAGQTPIKVPEMKIGHHAEWLIASVEISAIDHTVCCQHKFKTGMSCLYTCESRLIINA
jgi:hypothetical protein